MSYTFPKSFQLKNGETIIIREPQAADAERIVAFIKAVGDESKFLTFAGEDFKTTPEEERKILKDHHEASNQLYIIAELDGEIVGQLNVIANQKPRMKHQGEFGISVRKAHWGKGIANCIMHSMVDWAKSTQIIRKINLLARADNKKAIRMYEKFGFEHEGINRRDLFIDGQFYDAVYMGLLID